MLASMISNWTFSVALIWLIAWSDKTPGPSLITLFQFVTYSVVRSSVGRKPALAEGLNLLPNQIDSAMSILSAKVTTCVSCMSCIAGRTVKSEDSFNASETPSVHWLDDEPSESALFCCVSIASNACDSVRC